MRKAKIVLLSLVLSMSAAFGAACGTAGTSASESDKSDSIPGSSAQLPAESDSGASETTVSVTLDKASATVDLFGELTLSATVEGTTQSVVWETSDDKVAIVSSTGKITPVGVGTAVITASVVGAEATCAVTVAAPEEEIELDVSYTEIRLETGNTLRLQPSAYVGVKEIADGVYTFEAVDASVVSVAADGTVTALKEGTTSIKINGTFKGVAARELVLPVTVSVPKTHDAFTLTCKPAFYANRAERFSLDLSEYTYTEITTVSLGGKAVEFSIENNILSVERASFEGILGGDAEVLITGLTGTGDVMITGKMLYVNYAIGTAEELTAFGKACNVGGTARTPYMYVILTDNIDYGGGNFSAHYEGGYFLGTFDGQGYTINNIKAVNAVFPGIYGTGEVTSVLKNVAFTNVLRDTANGGALLVNDFNYAHIENVYVSGKFTAYTGGLCAGIAGSAGADSSMKNVLVYVDFQSNPGKYNALKYSEKGTAENCYAISPNSTGKMYGDVTEGLYTTIADFKAAVTELPSAFSDSWEMKEGMLVFKTAYRYAETQEVTLTAQSEGAEVANGSSLNFTVTPEKAELEVVVEDVQGFAIKGTTVAIGSEVAAGTRFKVRASYTDVISGKIYAAESSEYTVIHTQIAEIEGEQTAAKNRKEIFSFDLSRYNIVSLTSVTVGAAAVGASDYTFENGILTLSSEKISESGHLDVAMVGNIDNGYVYANAKVFLVDYAIGTAEELTAFGKACNVGGTAKTPYMYVILTDNIDYGGGNFSANYAGGYFLGTFDGQGYTINNIKAVNAVFPGIYGTGEVTSVLKNVAFTNVLRDTANGGALFVNDFNYAHIENVYVSGKFTAYTGGLCGGIAGVAGAGSSMKNVVVHVDFQSNPGKYNALAYTNTGKAENCYAISSNSTGKMYGDVTEGLYTTAEDFKAAVTTLPEGFDATCWEMKDGMLVFKSALTFSASAVGLTTDYEGGEIAQNGNLAFKAVSGTKLTLEAVNGELTGITVNGLTVTVGQNVAGGTEFKVIATYFDVITAKTYTETSGVYKVMTTQTETLSDEFFVAKNRGGAFEVDLSAYGIAEISSVNIGSQAVSQYTFEGGKLKGVVSGVAGGTVQIVVTGKTQSSYISVGGQGLVVDYAIGTAEELTAFGKACNVGGTARTPYMYVILTDNIDYGGGNFSANYAGGYFFGTFDGQGYTINNIKAVNAVFPGIYGTSEVASVLKNVAFTNVLRDTANGGALLVNDFNYAHIENVYVSGKFTAYTGGLCGGIAGVAGAGSSMKNVVVHVDFQSNPGKYNALAYSNTGKAENCYAISSNSTGKMYGEVTEGLYTTTEDFKAAVTTLPEGFDATCWEMRDGELIFKTVG